MQHLDVERLAAFDQTPFSEEEQAHLTACPACRRELGGMQQLVATAAATRTEVTVPLVPFERIAAGLQYTADGGVRDTVEMQPRAQQRSSPTRLTPWWGNARRAAAAMVMLLGGVAGGIVVGRVTANAGKATVASITAEDAPLTIASAMALLDHAQRDYERASLWLAANDSMPQPSEVYRARLAALDDMMAASRAALRDVPQDPVLNQYYLSAWAAREATLQQLGATLPVDKLVERY